MKNRSALLVISVALLVLAACSVSMGTAPTPSPSPSGPTLVDDEGTTTLLAAVPQTIVSLTPATTELLYALGVGERLRGRTDQDDYPAQATALPVVATFEGVHIEDVVAIAPDLVIAGGNEFTHRADVSRLRQLGILVIVVYAADVDGVLSDIRLVGKAVGREQAADRIVGAIQARIDEVKAAVTGLARPRTFYEIGYQPDIYGPAPQSFVADMVNLAGGDPITTTDPAVYSIPLERLVTVDPQVIVLGDAAYGICPNQIVGRPGWAGMTAVSDGQVRPVDDIVVTRPGPRLGEGLAALALAIHPDAAIAPPTAGTDYCPTL
ncbi:MAG: helical backbone metal receptor [Chloroflexota bacterium]